jgi:hypothetical protein
MNYTLILKDGRQMKFYVESVAEMYQRIYGGVLLNNNDRPHLKLVAQKAA